MTTDQERLFREWQIEQKRRAMFDAWLAESGDIEKLTTSQIASRWIGFNAALDIVSEKTA